jgi:hypothetical protein
MHDPNQYFLIDTFPVVYRRLNLRNSRGAEFGRLVKPLRSKRLWSDSDVLADGCRAEPPHDRTAKVDDIY